MKCHCLRADTRSTPPVTGLAQRGCAVAGSSRAPASPGVAAGRGGDARPPRRSRSLQRSPHVTRRSWGPPPRPWRRGAHMRARHSPDLRSAPHPAGAGGPCGGAVEGARKTSLAPGAPGPHALVDHGLPAVWRLWCQGSDRSRAVLRAARLTRPFRPPYPAIRPSDPKAA